MTLPEVVDKVGHPSLPTAYLTGLAVGIAACGVARIARSWWLGFVLAGIWLLLVALFTASYFVHDSIVEAFVDERGGAYFVCLASSGALPLLVVVITRRLDRVSAAARA